MPPANSPPLFARIFSGTAWIIGGRVLSVGALFASSSLLAYRMDDGDLGAYLMATFLMPFFAVLTNLGSQEILLRDLRRRIVRDDWASARQAFVSCLTICVTCCLILAVVIVGGARLVAFERPHWFGLQTNAPWLALWIFLQTTTQVCSEVARGLNRFGLSTALYTKSGGWWCNGLMAIMAVALWHNAESASLRSVLVVQTVAAGVPAAIGLWIVVGALFAPHQGAAQDALDVGLPDDEPVTCHDEPPTIAWMLRESWPLFVSYSVAIGIEQLDIFVVGAVASDSDVADYAVAKRWLSTLNFAYASLAPAITPFIAELYERRETQKIQRLLRGAATIIAVPTVVLCGLLFVLAAPATELFFSPQRLGAVPALRVQLFGQVVLSLAGHSYLALSMTGRQRSLMHCSLVVGAFYLAVGPLATIYAGTFGAGAAKSLAMAIQSALAAYLVYRQLGIVTVASVSPTEVRNCFQEVFAKSRRMLRKPVN